MGRIVILGYGVVCYLLGVVALVALIGFLLGWLPSKNINDGLPGPLWQVLAVNIGLIALFGVQHSIMARPHFKRVLTSVIPAAAERSTYVLMSAVALFALIWWWQPMPQTIWRIDHSVTRWVLEAIMIGGWLLVFYATFLISHWDLFGLRQIWLHWRQQPYTGIPMKTPPLYQRVRHPMQLGVLIGVWVTPGMTYGHLLFAVGMTIYIIIGVAYEERDLIANYGDSYRAYRQKIPAFFPSLSRKFDGQ